VILSIGNGGDLARVRDVRCGKHWALTFVNDDPDAFYDCMTFFDDVAGLRCRIRWAASSGSSPRTTAASAGTSSHAEDARCAAGEFALRGQRPVPGPRNHGRRAWFGTGGGAQARVFRSDDGGTTWQVSATPIHERPTAGIFALAFRGQQHGFAVGGDFLTPTVAPDSLAVTSTAARRGSSLPTRRTSTAQARRGSPSGGRRGRPERQRRHARRRRKRGSASTRKLRHRRLRTQRRLLGVGEQEPRGVLVRAP
jgi:hypothetical protein